MCCSLKRGEMLISERREEDKECQKERRLEGEEREKGKRGYIGWGKRVAKGGEGQRLRRGRER